MSDELNDAIAWAKKQTRYIDTVEHWRTIIAAAQRYNYLREQFKWEDVSFDMRPQIKWTVYFDMLPPIVDWQTDSSTWCVPDKLDAAIDSAIAAAAPIATRDNCLDKMDRAD